MPKSPQNEESDGNEAVAVHSTAVVALGIFLPVLTVLGVYWSDQAKGGWKVPGALIAVCCGLVLTVVISNRSEYLAPLKPLPSGLLFVAWVVVIGLGLWLMTNDDDLRAAAGTALIAMGTTVAAQAISDFSPVKDFVRKHIP